LGEKFSLNIGIFQLEKFITQPAPRIMQGEGLLDNPSNSAHALFSFPNMHTFILSLLSSIFFFFPDPFLIVSYIFHVPFFAFSYFLPER
jgi:hypothetical protein